MYVIRDAEVLIDSSGMELNFEQIVGFLVPDSRNIC
jgi:hypothetical protein